MYIYVQKRFQLVCTKTNLTLLFETTSPTHSKCVRAITTELRVISVLSRNPPKRVFF